MHYSEKGVTNDSLRSLHTPSTEAMEHLYYFTYTGLFYCTGNYRITRKANMMTDPYFYIFTRRGCMHLIYEGKQYDAKENECLLFDCRKAHDYFSDNDTIYQHFVFGGASSDYYYQKLCRAGCHLKPTNPQAIAESLAKISLYTEEPIPNEHLVSAEIHRVLSLTVSARENYITTNSQRVFHAISFMKQNIGNADLSLNTIADQAGLNPSYFSRIFRQYTGLSPYAYLINQRINSAQLLLTTSATSIEEISHTIGFLDCSHFIKIFREKTGCTPLAFRKLHMSL